MSENNRVLAFIGARSGSKGLKDKNIKQLNGKPLMAWTIEAALASEFVDSVVVSTDSTEYAEIATSYGAQVVLRPEELAGDDASLMAALQHGYQQIQEDDVYIGKVTAVDPERDLALVKLDLNMTKNKKNFFDEILS